MDDETKILRLITGEDIICGFHKISKDSYAVIDPMVLIVKYRFCFSLLPIRCLEKNDKAPRF